MKTIKNQVKYHKDLPFQCIHRGALGPVLFHFFKRLKEQQKTTNKNSIETFLENAVKNVKPCFGPQNTFDCSFLKQR